MFTSVFAAICAVALCLATERLLLGNLPSPNSLHFFIAGCTLVVYNAHFLLRKPEPRESDRYRWTLKNRWLHWVSFVAGVVMTALSLPGLSKELLIWSIFLGILSFGYTFPVLPLPQAQRLREFGWVKILTLTSVWTITTSVLPMIYHHHSIAAYPVELSIRFIFLFVLCVAFDIRDMQTDLYRNIRTIPNRIGTERSYRLIYTGMVVFLGLSVWQYYRVENLHHLLIACFVFLVSAGAMHLTRRHSSDRYFLGAIDGLMLLYGGLVALFGHYV